MTRWLRQMVWVSALAMAPAGAALADGTMAPGTPGGIGVKGDGHPVAVPGSLRELDRPLTDARDRQFIAAEVGVLRSDMDLDRLAIQRAQRPEVRDFALRLLQDHKQELDEVEQMLARKGERLVDYGPAAMPPVAVAPGEAFDGPFLRRTIDNKQRHEDLLSGERDHGTDLATRGFAARWVQPIQNQRRQAEELLKGL